MKVNEKVTITNASERSELYTLFVHASQGDYKEIVNGSDSNEIKKLEAMIKKSFDEFATKAFNVGREYEASKANKGKE